MLHYTAMQSAIGARDWLCSDESGVSAHYVLAEDGQLWQLVCETQRAWHAGAGSWGGVEDVNSRSIGIEIANTGAQPFPEPQMTRLEQMLADMLHRWTIPPAHVIGHSDCALGRKIDPGPRFDWQRLARQGLAIWPDPSKHNSGQKLDDAALPGAFLHDAGQFGYDTNHPLEGILAAMRMRFRPTATGPLAPEDARLMRALATRWPAVPPAVPSV